MRVTCLQLGVGDRPKDENIQHALELLDQAPQSDLILLPEIWPCGFFSYDRYFSESEPIEGHLVSLFRSQARQRRCHLLMGSFVERADGKLFNTSILFNPDGESLACYRKIHLFGYHSKEAELLSPGAEVVVSSTPWGPSGLSTCYDLRFPELFRKMVDQGAKFFLIPSAWPLARLDAWVLFNRARAHENLAYLISCNCVGLNAGLPFAGHSMVIDPWGRTLAEAGEDEALLTVEIDPGLVDAVRGEFPALADRVPL
jgi:predicted amidohydrolase